MTRDSLTVMFRYAGKMSLETETVPIHPESDIEKSFELAMAKIRCGGMPDVIAIKHLSTIETDVTKELCPLLSRMHHVIDTACRPKRFKVETARWPGNDNSSGNYFATYEEADKEAFRRNLIANTQPEQDASKKEK